MESVAHHSQAPASPLAGLRRTSVDVLSAAPAPDWLRVGAVVLDTRTGRSGEVQEWPYRALAAPAQAWLRPVGGGLEWTPRVADLRPVEPGRRP